MNVEKQVATMCGSELFDELRIPTISRESIMLVHVRLRTAICLPYGNSMSAL